LAGLPYGYMAPLLIIVCNNIHNWSVLIFCRKQKTRASYKCTYISICNCQRPCFRVVRKKRTTQWKLYHCKRTYCRKYKLNVD